MDDKEIQNVIWRDSSLHDALSSNVTIEKMATAIPPALDGGLRLRKA